MSALFNSNECNLAAFHASEAVSEEDERSLVIHDEIFRHFSFLIEIYKLPIVKASLMLILHRVCVLSKGSFAFLLCLDQNRSIPIDILRPDCFHRT